MSLDVTDNHDCSEFKSEALIYKYKNYISVLQTSVTRLPAPWGECVNNPDTATLYSEEYNVTYTKIACVKSCYQTAVADRCGCAMPEYPIPQGTSICNQTIPETGQIYQV